MRGYPKSPCFEMMYLFPFRKFSVAVITRKFCGTCNPLTYLPFNGMMWSTCHLIPVSFVLAIASLYMLRISA